jgi:hypothetical protein
VTKADIKRLEERLRPLRRRFRHGRQWSWDRKNLVDRVVSVAVAEEAAERARTGRRKLSREARMRVERTISLYVETNADVHSSAMSLGRSFERGSGREAVRPRSRENRPTPGAALLVASILLDSMAYARETLQVSQFSDRFDRIATRLGRLRDQK